MDDVPIVIDPPGADFMHVPDLSAEAMISVSRDPPNDIEVVCRHIEVWSA